MWLLSQSIFQISMGMYYTQMGTQMRVNAVERQFTFTNGIHDIVDFQESRLSLDREEENENGESSKTRKLISQ